MVLYPWNESWRIEHSYNINKWRRQCTLVNCSFTNRTSKLRSNWIFSEHNKNRYIKIRWGCCQDLRLYSESFCLNGCPSWSDHAPRSFTSDRVGLDYRPHVTMIKNVMTHLPSAWLISARGRSSHRRVWASLTSKGAVLSSEPGARRKLKWHRNNDDVGKHGTICAGDTLCISVLHIMFYLNV